MKKNCFLLSSFLTLIWLGAGCSQSKKPTLESPCGKTIPKTDPRCTANAAPEVPEQTPPLRTEQPEPDPIPDGPFGVKIKIYSEVIPTSSQVSQPSPSGSETDKAAPEQAESATNKPALESVKPNESYFVEFFFDNYDISDLNVEFANRARSFDKEMKVKHLYFTATFKHDSKNCRLTEDKYLISDYLALEGSADVPKTIAFTCES